MGKDNIALLLGTGNFDLYVIEAENKWDNAIENINKQLLNTPEREHEKIFDSLLDNLQQLIEAIFISFEKQFELYNNSISDLYILKYFVQKPMFDTQMFSGKYYPVKNLSAPTKKLKTKHDAILENVISSSNFWIEQIDSRVSFLEHLKNVTDFESCKIEESNRSVSTENNKTSLEIAFIENEFIETLKKEFVNYFKESEQVQVVHLLQGQKIKNPVTYKGSAKNAVKSFIKGFMESKIHKSKSDLINWICENIRYTKKNTSATLNKVTVEDYFKRTGNIYS